MQPRSMQTWDRGEVLVRREPENPMLLTLCWQHAHLGNLSIMVFSHCYLDETSGKSSLCIFKDINAHQGHKCTAGFLWLVHQLLVSGNTAFHAAQVNADVG